MRSRFLVILAAMAMMLFPACGVPVVSQKTGTEAVSLPDEARLRARLAEFHDALGANDIAKWYAMTAPGIRDKMTFEEFKKDMRWDENAARRKEIRMKGELGKVCSCTAMRTLRCVMIINVTIEDADGRVKKERPLEMWEYAAGEWYWGYMGPESRGRCPGER
jgi:hypothetical protein